MQLQRQFGEDHRRIYNQLGSVETASEELQELRTFTNFLTQLGSLADRHQLAGRVGAFLLHRHFPLRPDQYMLETPATDEDGNLALVTQPASVRVRADAEPTRWLLSISDEAWIPLEFSTDTSAVRLSRELAGNERFLEDFTRIVVDNDLESHIGLTVVERAGAISDTNDRAVVETTEDWKSIVKLHPRSEIDWTRLLITVWTPSETSGCTPTGWCAWRCIPHGDVHGRGHFPETGPHV